MKYKTWIEVSKSALEANVKAIKKIVGRDVFVLAVVKANAYGVGIGNVVVATKQHVDFYGVDSLDEANVVRANCQNPILILGYVSNEDAGEVVINRFSTVVYNYDFACALSSKATKENPARIHIKVDTGLCRLGLWPEEAIILAKQISRLPNIIIEGLYTHYAKLVDENNQEIFYPQLEKFRFVLNSLANVGIKPKLLHTASSMAAILYEETRFNMVRVGITIYGLWGRESLLNFINEKVIDFNLQNVLTWKTTIVNIKKLPAFSSIGYSFSEAVTRDTTVAVLGAGYYDGIDKRYGKIGYVLINGERAKILGSISMKMCMADVTDIKNVKVGDIAVIIGRSGQDEITAYEFANVIGTSTNEIISRINPLTPRLLVP